MTPSLPTQKKNSNGSKNMPNRYQIALTALLLVPGCVTRYVATDLPQVQKPSKTTVKWLRNAKAPDGVINDVVNCTAASEVAIQANKSFYELYFGAVWTWLSGFMLGLATGAQRILSFL
jgi:hypothetical protein